VVITLETYFNKGLGEGVGIRPNVQRNNGRKFFLERNVRQLEKTRNRVLPIKDTPE
jgi:hypothetical protein